MSAFDSTTQLSIFQFIDAAARFHRNAVTHLREGVWMIGRASSPYRVIVRVIAGGIEAWQPVTGRRVTWAA